MIMFGLSILMTRPLTGLSRHRQPGVPLSPSFQAEASRAELYPQTNLMVFSQPLFYGFWTIMVSAFISTKAVDPCLKRRDAGAEARIDCSPSSIW